MQISHGSAVRHNCQHLLWAETFWDPLNREPAPRQVMIMVGVKPVADALGRVNKLEVIPIEELGRPRIDVVVNCSGVFRDLFVNQVGAA